MSNYKISKGRGNGTSGNGTEAGTVIVSTDRRAIRGNENPSLSDNGNIQFPFSTMEMQVVKPDKNTMATLLQQAMADDGEDGILSGWSMLKNGTVTDESAALNPESDGLSKKKILIIAGVAIAVVAIILIIKKRKK